MVHFAKRSVALLLAVLLVMSTAVSAFAAGSPTEGGEPATAEMGSNVTVTDSKTATVGTFHKSSSTTIAIPAKTTVKGSKYTVVAIGPKLLANNKKAKKVVIKASLTKIKKGTFTSSDKNVKSMVFKKLPNVKNFKVEKGAFAGSMKTGTIWLPKGTSSATKKALETIFKKAGFSGTVKVQKK